MKKRICSSVGLPAVLYGHLILSDTETLSYYTGKGIQCEGDVGITIKMTSNLLILCYGVALRIVFLVLTLTELPVDIKDKPVLFISGCK